MTDEPDDLAKVNLDLVGRVVDQKYKVLALLGRGGMGAVYLAHHLQLNKDMALKTFATANLSEDTRQRFKREAQALGKLKHKNIVQVFDFGIAEGGLPYYTMEHLDGESVAERIARKGVLEVTEALYVFSQLCQGLILCHKNGVVHRDIKPANIFLELQSSASDAIVGVKLVDFGIAALSAASGGQQLTAAGTVFGSPLYMSPEQSLGEKVDARSDIYSSGCALFEMLTGKPPFRGATAFATMLMHQEVPAPTMAEACGLERKQSYPDWLEQLVAELLAKDPAERPQSLSEVLDIIDFNGKKWNQESKGHKSIKAGPDYSPSRSTSKTASSKIVLACAAISLLLFVGVLALQRAKTNAPSPADKVAVVKGAALPAVVAPFRVPSKKPGKICFHFPDKEIGKIGQGSEDVFVSACGDVEIEDGPAVFFRAGQVISDQPQLLKGFGSSDLFALYFDEGVSPVWSDKTAASVEHLTSVKKLIFSSSKFTASAVASLNHLPDLADLGLGDSTLDGEALLGLKCLAKMESLVVSRMKNVSPVIARLAQHNRMRHFTVQECRLTDTDMVAIGKMPELLMLNVESNSITAQKLSALLNLPNLKRLNLDDNPIGPSALAVMIKLKTPMVIVMPGSFWNDQTIAAMEKRFGARQLNSRSYLPQSE